MFPKSIERTVDPAYIEALGVDDPLAGIQRTFERHGARWVKRDGSTVVAGGGVASSEHGRYIGTGAFIEMGVVTVTLDRAARSLSFTLALPWWLPTLGALGAIGLALLLGPVMRSWLWIPVIALGIWLFAYGGNFALAASNFRWLVERFMNESTTGDQYRRPEGATGGADGRR